jgi:hypothetical protein
MSELPMTKPANDQTRIGEYAALQPVSGVTYVTSAPAVNGLGRGGCVSREGAEKKAS